MDELPKSMRGEENFFDDGDDNIIGRIDAGENFVDAYDLHEANPGEVESKMGGAGTGSGPGENKINADEYDFRMEGRGNPKAPKGLKGSSQHTGPKGVKKDYEDSKQAVRIQKNFDRMRANRGMSQAVTGAQNFYIDDIVHEMSQMQTDATTTTAEDKEREKAKERVQRRRQARGDSDFSNSDSDSDDERLFAKFREERLRTIQASLPSYGSYMKAETLEDLAELLKNNHELCYVVVHAYQNKNNCCISLHLTFEAIAAQFPHVAFVRVRSDVALGDKYSAAALPTLLLYKGSKLHKSVISVGTILGPNPTDRDVVKFLADQEVLRMPSMGLENIQRKDKRVWREDYEEGNSDDEGKGSKRGGVIRTSNLTRGFGGVNMDGDMGILGGSGSVSSSKFANAFADDDEDFGGNGNDDDDDDFFNM